MADQDKLGGLGAILVADGAAASREELAALLLGDGYEVRTSDSGDGVMAAITSQPPDLILLAVGLPGLDAFEVCRQLKARAESRDIPVLFILPFEARAARAGAFEVGAADFITTPFQSEEVRARVQAHLALRLLSAQIAHQSFVLQMRSTLLQSEVAERQRAEIELRKLSRAVEQSPAAILITDPLGNIEYVNPKFTQLTGYTAEEALGQNPRILKSGDKPPEAYRELWETITSGREWQGELHNRKKNGDPFWEYARIGPIRSPEGAITHFLAVKEDITERKKAQEEREHLIDELTKALADVKTLSGIIPICAGCKKIRDDKGFWNQVESYVQKHSLAKFSHGMCPDCIKEYYPEFADAAAAGTSHPDGPTQKEGT